MSGNVNNGQIQLLNVKGEVYRAGVRTIDLNEVEISYAPRTKTRPPIGEAVTLDLQRFIVHSVEQSRYVPKFVVLRARRG